MTTAEPDDPQDWLDDESLTREQRLARFYSLSPAWIASEPTATVGVVSITYNSGQP